MIQRWIRQQILPETTTCSLCGGVLDVYGDHCLVCPCGGDRTKRHNLLRNSVFHFCLSAGLSPELEKPNLLNARPHQGAFPENGVNQSPQDSRRPADVFLPRWRAGLPAALDFAVTSGLRQDIVQRTFVDPTSATSSYEDHKREHNNTETDCEAEGITFIPMVMEADGGSWGSAASKVFAEIAKTNATRTGDSRTTTLSQLYTNLGVTLHRENARAILRRTVRSGNFTQMLAAAAELQS